MSWKKGANGKALVQVGGFKPSACCCIEEHLPELTYYAHKYTIACTAFPGANFPTATYLSTEPIVTTAGEPFTYLGHTFISGSFSYPPFTEGGFAYFITFSSSPSPSISVPGIMPYCKLLGEITLTPESEAKVFSYTSDIKGQPCSGTTLLSVRGSRTFSWEEMTQDGACPRRLVTVVSCASNPVPDCTNYLTVPARRRFFTAMSVPGGSVLINASETYGVYDPAVGWFPRGPLGFACGPRDGELIQEALIAAGYDTVVEFYTYYRKTMVPEIADAYSGPCGSWDFGGPGSFPVPNPSSTEIPIYRVFVEGSKWR